LEDHGDVAVFRRDVGHIAVADQHAPRRDLLEAGQTAQRRRLAAARRADKHEELFVIDRDVEILQDVVVAKLLVDVFVGYAGHGCLPISLSVLVW